MSNNTKSPSETFEILKSKQQEITLQELKDSYAHFIKLANKYKTLGQTKSLNKLLFLANALQKEEKLIELGITKFVYKDVIEDYIDNVTDDVIKIIELKNYTREVPDEMVEIVEKTKELFDEYYVVFTDYTKKEERKIAQERRDKDPILFGCFKKGDRSSLSTMVADRFYVLGDWVDEYCDLTLDKLIAEYTKKKNKQPVNDIVIPKDSTELCKILSSYKETIIKDVNNDDVFTFKLDSDSSKSKKQSFFNKVRTFFGKKNNESKC